MQKKNLLNFILISYVKYSIHVALAVVTLALLSAHIFRLTLPFSLLIFIFSVTLLGYNTIKYGLFPKRYLGTFPRPLLFVLNGMALVVAGVSFFSLSLQQQVLSFFTGLLVLRYGNFFPFQKTYLRTQSGLKLFWVACCWVLIAIGLPYLEGAAVSLFALFLWGLQMGLFVVVATLPFELRDMHLDPVSLQTWPQKWGEKATKNRGYLLTSVAVCTLPFIPQISGPMLGSTLLTQGLLLSLLWQSHPSRGFYYAAFWVEALPLFWWGCLKLFLYIVH